MQKKIVESGQYVLPLGDIKRERRQYLLPLENCDETKQGLASLVGTNAHFVAVIASDNYVTERFAEEGGRSFNSRKRIQDNDKNYFFMDTQYHVADSLTEETHEVASLREVIGIFNEIGVSDFVFHRQDSDLSYDCGPNEAHCVRGLHSYEVCQLERMK